MKAAKANLDRRIVVPPSQGAAAATSTGIQTTGIQATSSNWWFASLQTLSGNSLCSLEQYKMDWNAADSGEVSSQLPLGPGLLAQKMLAVKVTVDEADKVAEVNTTE